MISNFYGIEQVFQEANDPETNDLFREKLIDPIIEVLEKPNSRKLYIEYGSEFLDANAVMLAKEYPTVKVVFPRRYVDRVCELFNWTNDSLKDLIRELLSKIKDKTTYQTFLATPTNFIHAVVLFYADASQHRQLRDSARQQMGLTMYHIVFNRQFKTGINNIPAMAYTYMTLDNSWGLIRAENVMTWIGQTVDGAYAHNRTKFSLNLSLERLLDLVKDCRSRFQQNMRVLSSKYYENVDNHKEVGEDLKGDEDYVTTTNTVIIRQNLITLIKTGDSDYNSKQRLYVPIAKYKNVKVDDLYDFAHKIKHPEISKIIDLIFYIFIVKEHNTLNDINSSKYIGRITNFPTAVDRAIAGKPVIVPLSNKYHVDSSIVKAYICVVATFILLKIGRIRNILARKGP